MAAIKVYKQYRDEAHNARRDSKNYISSTKSRKRPDTTHRQIAFRTARNSNYDQRRVFDQLFNPKDHLTEE